MIIFSVIAQPMPQQPLDPVKTSSEKMAQILTQSSTKISNLSTKIEEEMTLDGARDPPNAFIVKMSDKHEKDTLKAKFEKAWNDFIIFINHDQKPQILDYVKYFQHLQYSKKYKPVVLWTLFNRLQQSHHSYYKEDIRAIPELCEMSKKLKNPDIPQEYKNFHQNQIEQFLLQHPYQGID